MRIRGLIIITLTVAISGCVSTTSSNSLKNIRTVQIGENEFVYKGDIIKRIQESEKLYIEQFKKLTIRIAKLESELSATTNRPNKGQNNTIWACILTPPFTDKRFLASSPNKTAAKFEVIEKCKEAGIDDFYCNENNIECFNE